MPIGKGNVNKPNPLTEGKTRSNVKQPKYSKPPVKPPCGTKTERLYEEASIPEDKPFDSLAFIMDFESGDLSVAETIDGFQHLLDSGLVWSLQGLYGRMATRMLEAGLIQRR